MNVDKKKDDIKHLTIFSGITFAPKLTFVVNGSNEFVFPDDVHADEIKERLTCQIDSCDYGCKRDTLDIFRKAIVLYTLE